MTKHQRQGAPIVTAKSLFKILVNAFRTRQKLLIVGAPGVGKSDVVVQAADYVGYDWMIEHPVISDPTDFKGFAFINPETGVAEFVTFANLEKMIKATAPLVVFLDDLGQAPPSVQAACMQLLLAREIGGKKISDHVIFVAATNRREDNAGVRGVLDPVKSRFHSIIQLDPDADSWLAWAEKAGVNKYVRAFIARRPALLWDFKANQDMINQPSPRTVAHAGEILDAGYDRDVLRALLSGCTGKGWTDEFLAFMDMVDRMIDPNVVIQAPDSVDVPEDMDVLYVLCLALADRATDKNFNNIMKFTGRISREFQKLLVTTATSRDEELKNTSGYITWAAANPELHN